MIIHINQNNVWLPFDVVSSRRFLTVSVRPDSPDFFPRIMCQGLAYFVEPLGSCNFGVSRGKLSWLVLDVVPYGTLFLAVICHIRSRDFGKQSIVNGNGKQEDGKRYDV